MADEYISKQAFNDAIREAVRKYPNTFYNGLEVARQIAHDIPSADVAPVRHGRWEKNDDGIMVWWECSECHRNAWYDGDNLYDYCPDCGCKMDGGET